MTNDFIALFKDSSLVSVIAMVELTKSYSILASASMNFFKLGIITAFLYFCMSYPLSLYARKLEKKLTTDEPSADKHRKNQTVSYYTNATSKTRLI